MKYLNNTAHSRRSSIRAGFSLLELVVVMSIMAILAGAAIPVVRRAIDHAARKSTLIELEALASATVAFFEDTGSLPLELGALTTDPDLAGWTGPYIGTIGRDLRTGRHSAEVDGWSFPYRLKLESASILSITSPGPDGQLGAFDDYSTRVDVTPVRRARTLELLGNINRAIEQYNQTFLTSDPLPAEYALLLQKLVTRGFLPAAEPWAVDGWGAPFEPSPAGATPVVRVASETIAR